MQNIFIIACVVGLAIATRQTVVSKRVISPTMVIWAMPLLTLAIPISLSQQNTFSTTFNWTLAFGTIGIAIAHCLYHTIPLFHKLPPQIKNDTQSRITNAGTIIYISYIIYSIASTIHNAGGPLQAMAQSRLSIYLKEGILAGNTTYFLLLIPQLLTYIKIQFWLTSGNTLRALGSISCISSYYLLHSNTRLPIIIPIIALFTLLIENQKKIAKGTSTLIALPIGIACLSLYAIVGQAIRTGTISQLLDIENPTQAVSNKVKGDFGYHDWLNQLATKIENDELQTDWFKGWTIYPAINFIPRSIWQEKPITSTSNRLTELIYESKIGDGVAVTTYTIFGDGLWQGHLFGVFLAPILFLLSYSFLIGVSQRMPNTRYLQIMLLLQMCTMFRSELPITHVITTAASLLFIKKFCLPKC